MWAARGCYALRCYILIFLSFLYQGIPHISSSEQDNARNDTRRSSNNAEGHEQKQNMSEINTNTSDGLELSVVNVQLPKGVDQQREDSGIVASEKCKEIDENSLDSLNEKVYQKNNLGKSDSSSASSGIGSVD